MAFKFGKNSKEKLETCHEDLQKIMNLAISRSKVDFGISEGHRSIERQQELFKKGLTKIDGVTKKGKHNYNPSLAADIFGYHPDAAIRRKIMYDQNTLSYVAGVVDACALELLAKGETSHVIRWGGNWDSDGVIAIDQSFFDFPHFELKEIKS